MENKYTDFGFSRVRSKDKSNLVKNLFENVSFNYDLMNDFMSLGIHRVWKGFMLDWLAPRKGQSLIDVAGGTGDIALDFIKSICNGLLRYHLHHATSRYTNAMPKIDLKFCQLAADNSRIHSLQKAA